MIFTYKPVRYLVTWDNMPFDIVFRINLETDWGRGEGYVVKYPYARRTSGVRTNDDLEFYRDKDAKNCIGYVPMHYMTDDYAKHVPQYVELRR